MSDLFKELMNWNKFLLNGISPTTSASEIVYFLPSKTLKLIKIFFISFDKLI